MSDENYAERLAALREENEFLRQAARTFGELAERLAKELHEIRLEARHNQRRSATSGRNSTFVAPPSSFR
jgi:hypothetical protein